MSATTGIPQTPRARPANDERDMAKLGPLVRRVVKRVGVEALRQRAENAFPSSMTPDEFRTIREALGLTQAALAKVLGYSGAMGISKFERSSEPREVPLHVAMLMEAFRDGYRPKGWPE